MTKAKKKQRILVIAHDAGAGEIIGAYVKKYSKTKKFISYVAGPAARVFEREHIMFDAISENAQVIARIIENHSSVDFVLLGTGWMTSIERMALSEAKKKGMRTVAYLESWSNFRERFGYPNKRWKAKLPDEIWVGDKPALLLASQYFKTAKVRYVPNQYFVNISTRYRTLKDTLKVNKVADVLFLSDAVAGTEKVFSDFLSALPKRDKKYYIRVRFHPADNRNRFDKLIDSVKEQIIIEKSEEKDLVRDLLHGKVVVGTETVAMVGAVIVGKKTIGISLLGKKKAMLPFPKIIRAHDAQSAALII